MWDYKSVYIRAAVMIWAILVNTHTHTHTRTQTASMLQMSYRKDTLNGYLLGEVAIAVISIHHMVYVALVTVDVATIDKIVDNYSRLRNIQL